jgi:hypothetical protein
MTEQEEFDAWFARKFVCADFNGSRELGAAMGYAWAGFQEARATALTALSDEAIMSLWDATNGGQRIRPFILEFARKVIAASQSKEPPC